MAISYDNSLANGTDYSASPATIAYTVGAHNNSILLVYPVSTGTDAFNVSGVTYNGVSMTQIGGKIVNGTGYNAMYCFALPIASPDGSSHNISITQSGSPVGFRLVVASYYGVAQTSPEVNANNATQNNSAWSCSITTLTNNAWIVGGFRTQGSNNGTASTDTTSRVNDSIGDHIIEYSSNPLATAGSKTLNMSSLGVNPAWGNVGILVSLAPYSAPPVNSNFFALFFK